MAGEFGAVDPGDELAEIADAGEARATELLACAKIERVDAFTLRLAFDVGNDPCSLDGIVYAGALRVEYARPEPDTLLTTLYYEPLTGDETTLDGFSQLTWGTDGSQRLVTEIGLDAPNQRQIELQSDRVLFRSAGELKVDGWRRWQTLMGRWEADLAVPEELVEPATAVRIPWAASEAWTAFSISLPVFIPFLAPALVYSACIFLHQAMASTSSCSQLAPLAPLV